MARRKRQPKPELPETKCSWCDKMTGNHQCFYRIPGTGRIGVVSACDSHTDAWYDWNRYVIPDNDAIVTPDGQHVRAEDFFYMTLKEYPDFMIYQ